VSAQVLREPGGVIKAMDQLYPDLGEHLEEETTVAIDGALHETAYYQPIRDGCEIFFIPKLEGDNPGEVSPRKHPVYGKVKGPWTQTCR
jgi:hypothetical protein